MYHYLHMARGNYREYLQGERVRSKKYFYVLRPVLACAWIEKHHTMPPIVFERLVEDALPAGSELRSIIDELLARKRAGDELDDEPRIDALNAYLEKSLAYYEKLAAGLTPSRGAGERDLDGLFRSVLRDVWKGEGVA